MDGEAARKLMLQMTIAAFFGDDPATMICPTCPGCNEGPTMVLYHQCFCGNDDCQVLTWDPTEPAEKFKATATEVRITEGGD